jgi:phytoene dehydrogenase-like protein
MTRRELLRGLAGVGLLACRGRPTGGRTIAGSIVGGSHARGHLVRDGFRPAPVRQEETGVAIVGAGVAGLSAAWALERAGCRDFVVLELEDVPGGTARSGSSSLTPYPWGAHYVPAPPRSNRPLVALLEEIGAVRGRDASGNPVWAEEMLCRDPQERLFAYGAWYEGLFPRIGAPRRDLAALDELEQDMRQWAARRDAKGRRAFDLPRARSSREDVFRDLDQRSMASYVAEKGWTSPRMRWYLEYGCRDDFGSNLEQTSAWAGIHYFAARIPEGGTEPAEFLTWPEGNGRLAGHLASVAGTRLRTGALTTAIDPGTGRVVYLDTLTGEAVGLRAEAVVCAVPRFVAERLLPRGSATPSGAVYGSWMVANLHLRDHPASTGFPLAWDNVLYESPSLGYVSATHQSGRDQGPTVLTYYLPLIADDAAAARRAALGRTWEEWVRLILKDLRPAHPGIEDLVERVDVYLWGHAMVRPSPGFLWGAALERAARPVGRVHFAHTDLSGLALFEEAQYWGIHAAEEILEARKAAFTPWL